MYFCPVCNVPFNLQCKRCILIDIATLAQVAIIICLNETLIIGNGSAWIARWKMFNGDVVGSFTVVWHCLMVQQSSLMSVYINIHVVIIAEYIFIVFIQLSLSWPWKVSLLVVAEKVPLKTGDFFNVV